MGNHLGRMQSSENSEDYFSCTSNMVTWTRMLVTELSEKEIVDRDDRKSS